MFGCVCVCLCARARACIEFSRAMAIGNDGRLQSMQCLFSVFHRCIDFSKHHCESIETKIHLILTIQIFAHIFVQSNYFNVIQDCCIYISRVCARKKHREEKHCGLNCSVWSTRCTETAVYFVSCSVSISLQLRWYLYSVCYRFDCEFHAKSDEFAILAEIQCNPNGVKSLCNLHLPMQTQS